MKRSEPCAMRTYGFDAVALSNAYDLEELDQLRLLIEAKHANPLVGGHPTENGRPTIYLYDKKGRQKLDKITWAITYRLGELRRARQKETTS